MKLTEFLPNNLMLAPLAGYTDIGMRQLASDNGCGIVVTEMVSAMSLKQKNRTAFSLLGKVSGQAKNAVQLFGHMPDVFAEVVQYEEISTFDILDINMGCPVPKVTRNGEGSALMQNLPLAESIIKSARKYTKGFLTVKMRLGWDEENINCVQLAKICQDNGVDGICVHGRTKVQMYGGKANYEQVAKVVAAVDIPVFANGDVTSKQDSQRILQETGAFGIAVGRGAIGNTEIFRQILGKHQEVEKLAQIMRHYDIMLTRHSDSTVASEMKKHMPHYLKGMRGGKKFLPFLFETKDTQAQKRCLQKFFENCQHEISTKH